jgi:hypothetical protein
MSHLLKQIPKGLRAWHLKPRAELDVFSEYLVARNDPEWALLLKAMS